MVGNLKILIADADVRSGEQLKQYLQGQSSIEIAEVCTNGYEVEQKIRMMKPDFLLLDLIMPGKDGISIMESIRQMQVDVSVVVTTVLEHSEMINCAFSLGADYYLSKPYDLQVVYDRVMQIASRRLDRRVVVESHIEQVDDMLQEKVEVPAASCSSVIPMMSVENDVLEEEVTRTIRMFGIPANIKGYQYIREGIMLSLRDKEMLSYITKFLYPTIAKEYRTTSSSVERAIRHAIGVAWEKGNARNVLSSYGYYCDMKTTKPTNSEFLSLLVDRFRMEKDGSCVACTARVI